ncbi:MAG: methyltransferase domain-containing protein [candidate division Zixibacteria bacterium]|nr:methyltransferase domain-containing protein [candidate division Zixibacteria bacterium]
MYTDTQQVQPYVRLGSAILPPAQMRLCGEEFKDDAYYLESTRKEAQKLIDRCGLSINSSILDVGCGVGRLATGLIEALGTVRKYRGIDVMPGYVQWCRMYISSQHPSFQFMHLNMANDRYNPGGMVIDENFKFPFDDDEFDLIYLYSVFSHMDKEDVRNYLRDFYRILKPDGKIFFTTFVEENVPDFTVNPEGYRMNWNGALHCVRFDKSYLEKMLDETGFRLDLFDYEKETDGQSGLYISHKNS